MQKDGWVELGSRASRTVRLGGQRCWALCQYANETPGRQSSDVEFRGSNRDVPFGREYWLLYRKPSEI